MTTQIKKDQTVDIAEVNLRSSVQVITLVSGLYLFSVRSATPTAVPGSEGLSVPAVQISFGPGTLPDDIQLLSDPNTKGFWLSDKGDCVVVRVSAPRATLVLTSVAQGEGEPLSIGFERIGSAGLENLADPRGSSKIAASPAKKPTGSAPAIPANGASPADDPSVPIRIVAHVRNRGDLEFKAGSWAGRVRAGWWIEAFSMLPAGPLSASDIEYKSLTASGFETPWITNGAMCGTQGMGTPLLGFAVRMKARVERTDFDCEYSGYFQSGSVMGPLRNGAPCKSSKPNDALEGILLKIVPRSQLSADKKAATTGQPGSPPSSDTKGDNVTGSTDHPVVRRTGATVSEPRHLDEHTTGPGRRKATAAKTPVGVQKPTKRALTPKVIGRTASSPKATVKRTPTQPATTSKRTTDEPNSQRRLRKGTEEKDANRR